MEKSIQSKPLSKVTTSAGIPFLTPEVSPGTHCPMRMASVIVEDIKGLSSLLVGMPECATHSRLFSPSPEGDNGELHWSYVLDSREVIFGCRDGVMEALKKMDQTGAKYILVIATCIPDLIGEDFEGVIQEMQCQLSARLAFVMLGQFKNISYPSGSWKTMEAIAGMMESQKKQPNCINILGQPPTQKQKTNAFLLSYLEDKGFHLRYLAPGADIDDFCAAPDAALNLVVSPYTLPLAIKMKKKFRVPYVSLHNRYSIVDIDHAYSMILKKLDMPWEGTVESGRLEALDVQRKAKEIMGNKTFIMTTRIDLTLPLTKFLVTTLDMKPLLLHLEEYYPEDREHTQMINEAGYDPRVCRIVNEYTAMSMVKELCPDIGFGYVAHRDETIPWVYDMFDFYGQVGYERTQAVLERFLSVAGAL